MTPEAASLKHDGRTQARNRTVVQEELQSVMSKPSMNLCRGRAVLREKNQGRGSLGATPGNQAKSRPFLLESPCAGQACDSIVKKDYPGRLTWNGFLSDTNVISEFIKPQPASRVIDWLEAPIRSLFASVITLERSELGIEDLPGKTTY